MSVTVDQGASPPSAPGVARTEPPALSGVGLAKSFGPTRALRSCSLELRAGEIHCVVGENGSGKSTLVKILAGIHRPDRGQVLVEGRPIQRRPSPRAAQQAGVFTVFQEVLVVGAQSVLENVWLGADGLLARHVEAADCRLRAESVLSELFEAPPALEAPADSLSLSERQACCIARALVRDPRVLILDESTSALDVVTRDRLFALVRRLCSQGSAVMFISHRMDEIEELGDRVTVMRSGESVACLERGQATSAALVLHMTGSDHLTSGVQTVAPRLRVRGDVVVRTDGLRLTPSAPAVEFSLHAGELVGVAGLEGHGQDAFLHALRGAGSAGGRVICDGEAICTPARALARGIVYVPRDRRGEAIFPTQSIADNFGLPTLTRDRRLGVLNLRSVARRLTQYVDELGIRMRRPRQAITVLSGGNQQKVILARWLAARPRVMLLNDPTRGVDLAAKRDLYGVLERLAADGVAVVMLSSEVDEHVELMDRVLVFREGSVSALLDRNRLTREALVAAFFGRTESHDE